ncbi:MAG: radical SAM protein [Candidatus Methanofastidiosia archaeon]
MKIRLSCGSEAKLGLRKIKTLAPNSTIYLFTRGICQASCAFCAQSTKHENKMLSRVDWNLWELNEISPLLSDEKRVCIQCLNYPGVFEDVMEIAEEIKCPVSLSAQPFSVTKLREISGRIDKISINLDCFTRPLFQKFKSYYDWDLHWARLKKAVSIFGSGNVISHLIVGLGESEKEAVGTIKMLAMEGIVPSLFAFTPLKGAAITDIPPPQIGMYRRLQIARHLLVNQLITAEDILFCNGKISSFGKDVEDILSPSAFETQGCPNCNRPFYNEVPGRVLYNYPFKLSKGEYEQALIESEVV